MLKELFVCERCGVEDYFHIEPDVCDDCVYDIINDQDTRAWR